MPIPRTAFEHNLPILAKPDQRAPRGRVAAAVTLNDLLFADLAGLLQIGEYPLCPVVLVGFTGHAADCFPSLGKIIDTSFFSIRHQQIPTLHHGDFV